MDANMMNLDPNAMNKWDAGRLQKVYIGNTVLAIIFVALRMSARYNQAVGIGPDDYLILVSVVLLLVNLGLGLMMLHNGLGNSTLYLTVVDADELVRFQKIMFAFEPIYALTLTVIKISILIMYTRIFALSCFRKMAWILSSIIAVYTVTFIGLCMFRCVPVESSWGSPLDDEKCLDLKSILIGYAVPNIGTDLGILVVPIQKVWTLKVELIHRIELMGLFLLGCFVIFASSYRLATVINIDNNDISGTAVETLVWSHVETSVAITSACLPTLRPILRKLVRRFYQLQDHFNASWRPAKEYNCHTPESTSDGTGMIQTARFLHLPEVHRCHEVHPGFLVLKDGDVEQGDLPGQNIRALRDCELQEPARVWRAVP